ncbi:MAG: hypothetical protein MMC33_007675 [Icmadophila ericetorum]|nr:hypothetical protein [Icmadophila ericetorum]
MLFNVILLCLVIASVVHCGLFTDILNGIIKSGRYAHLISDIPQNILNDLENDAVDAGIFVCQILDGDFPEALDGIASDIEGEIEEDFDALTSFVQSIPSLAPVILNDIVDGVDDVVSVVEELITNPAAILTDLEHIGETIACVFHIDCSNPTTTTAIDSALSVLVSSCSALLDGAAAATSTVAAAIPSTTSPAAAASTPSPAAPSTLVAATSTVGAAPADSPTTSFTASYMEPTGVNGTPTGPAYKNTNEGTSGLQSSQLWLWLAPLSAVMGLMILL